MLKQISGTVAARVFVTVMNLLVIVLAGHSLGADGLGTISLIVLGITLVLIPVNLMGGGALVQLAPHHRPFDLLKPTYAWAAVTVIACAVLLPGTRLVPRGYALHVCVLALMQAVYGAHLSILLGQQRIGKHNFIVATQAACLLIVFAWRLWPEGPVSAMAYVEASYASFGVSVLLSSAAVQWRVDGSAPRDIIVPRLLRQGLLVQGANALQLVNYRFVYVLLERCLGRAELGVYSVANQLAEGAWIAPRSMGMVLLSRVSNLRERIHQRAITITTAKLAVGSAIVVMGMLILLPEVFFRKVFGPGVVGLRLPLFLLAPGILAMSASQAFSHYFSGSAQNQHNLAGSGLGFLVSIGLGLWLVPAWGLAGAAITASAAYTTAVVYQLIVFFRQTGGQWRDLLPNAGDRARVRELLRWFRV